MIVTALAFDPEAVIFFETKQRPFPFTARQFCSCIFLTGGAADVDVSPQPALVLPALLLPQVVQRHACLLCPSFSPRTSIVAQAAAVFSPGTTADRQRYQVEAAT